MTVFSVSVRAGLAGTAGGSLATRQIHPSSAGSLGQGSDSGSSMYINNGELLLPSDVQHDNREKLSLEAVDLTHYWLSEGQ